MDIWRSMKRVLVLTDKYPASMLGEAVSGMAHFASYRNT
jgi:hypothetical protein